ncbi:tetratricopeptide repeat protein [Vibrio salinus]|uniref:tetratricopeptide repeat protein n=1 Tax=Vibrio salinus TaxID=2899784 RepID=UPI001E37CD1D|nr:tetratricopeptide repeat protein [Vibrio salinus]MCE0495836.1 tetratricopeptide repeat protein [Vibrio salinus]
MRTPVCLKIFSFCFLLCAHFVFGADLSVYQTQTRWAVCQYDYENSDEQEGCFQTLIEQLNHIVTSEPDNMEMATLLAINYASLAGVTGGMKGLSLARKAKDILENVNTKKPDTLHGASYLTLGALYYRAPGWPISFGSKKRARTLLKKALKMNPQSLTANYFYADFLAQQGKADKAIRILHDALKIQINPKYQLAGEGRKRDIEALLLKLEKKR